MFYTLDVFGHNYGAHKNTITITITIKIIGHGYLGDVRIKFNETCYMDIKLPHNQQSRNCVLISSAITAKNVERIKHSRTHGRLEYDIERYKFQHHKSVCTPDGAS